MFGVERLRPDWQIKNYVIPISRIEIGDEFWQEARILKDSWNEIVTEYRSFDTSINALEAEFAEAKKEKLDASGIKENLSKFRKERKVHTLKTWKAQSAKIFSNDLENLQVSVNSAINQAFKSKGTMHFKRGITAINFCKRFGSGGVNFGKLLTEFDSRDDKLKRRSVAMRVGEQRESNRSRQKIPLHGHFLVGKARVPVKFTGLWSYPSFPDNAFVKKVSLIGKFSPVSKWQWSLVATVEEPPLEDFRPASLPIAALDLGYRRFPDYIRFGFIVDSLGNKFELRLPHGNMMSSYLRNTIKFLAKKGVEKQYIKDLNDFFVWDSVQGTSLEETKTQLKKISELAKKQAVEMPEAWKGGFLGFGKMRNRGLIKLKKISNEILDEGAETNESVQDILKQTIEIIEKWQIKDSYFEMEKEHFRRKFLGRRKLLFRSLVKWLVEHYAQLIWEEDLKLGVIAAKSKKSSRVTDAALKESNKYRQWTGLSITPFHQRTSSENAGVAAT